MWAAQYRATNGSYDPGVAEPWEWREQDLLDLITNGVQENLNLDYKHRASLDNNDVRKNEIGKDVSAFANSDGGTLVYGMEENGHLPVRLEGVDPSVTTREWLEQVINSKIRPKVDAIRINPIPLTAPRTGTVFVVYVPASPRAAHMASDHKHYKRYNFQSVPMEHYELEDVRRRHAGPLLSLGVTQLMPAGANRVRIDFLIRNASPVMAMYSLLLLKVEDGTLISSSHWDSERSYPRGMVLQKNVSVPERLPIWQGVPLSLGASITVACADHTDFCLEWNLYSPDMQPQSGVFWLQAVNGVISEVEVEGTIATLNTRRAERNKGLSTGLIDAE
jgi:hypothetical protein